MFNETINHIERTWNHVLHGQSTTVEKLEFGVESVGAVIGLAAFAKLGLSRYIRSAEAAAKVESILPKLGIEESENVPQNIKKSVVETLNKLRLSPDTSLIPKALESGMLPEIKPMSFVEFEPGKLTTGQMKTPEVTPNLVSIPMLRTGYHSGGRAISRYEDALVPHLSTEAAVYQKNKDAIVRLNYANDKFIKTGTGFFVRKDGLGVTNYHVVQGAPGAINVITSDGNIFKASFVARDRVSDLALFQIEADCRPTFNTVRLAERVSGDKIFTIGHPEGRTRATMMESPILHTRLYRAQESLMYQDGASRFDRQFRTDLLTDANASSIRNANFFSITHGTAKPGASGSPGFDRQGGLISILNSGTNDGAPIASAVGRSTHIAHLKALLGEIPVDKKIDGWLDILTRGEYVDNKPSAFVIKSTEIPWPRTLKLSGKNASFMPRGN